MMRVLIVEDDEYNQLVLKGMIEILFPEWETVIVSNGAEALEKLQKTQFNLLLSDVSMPVMDGYGLIDALKKMNLAIPKICVTAFAIKNDKEKLLEYGFDAYVSKPIDLDELKNVLDSFCNIETE